MPETAAEWLIAGSLLASSTLALSGFPQYDIPQTATAALLAAMALALWAGGRASWKSPDSKAPLPALLAWLAVAIWTLAAGATDGSAEGWDHAVRFFLPVPLLVWSAAPAGPFDPRRATGAAVAIASLTACGTAILQRAGIDFPQAIPFAHGHEFQVRALFDNPSAAAAFFGSSLAVLTLLATGAGPGQSSAHRALLAVSIFASSVGMGLTADAGVLWVAVIAGLVGAISVVAIDRDSSAAALKWLAGPALLAAVAFQLAAPTGVDALRPELAAREEAGIGQRASVASMAWLGEPDAARDEDPMRWWDASLRFARNGLPFGQGGGSWWEEAGGLLSGENDAPRDSTGALVEPGRRSRWPLLQLAGEYGPLLPLLLLLALLAALRIDAASQHREAASTRATVAVRAGGARMATAIGLGLLALSPGFLFGAPLLLLGACVALLIGRGLPEATAAPRRSWDRALSAGLPVAAACALLLGHAAKTMAWGFEAARATVFLGHGYLDEAARHYEGAAQFQVRYETELNLGLVKNLSPEARDPDAALDHLTRAVDLRREWSIPRVELADIYLRTRATGTPEDAEDELGRAGQMLDVALRLDPGAGRAALTRADIFMALSEHTQAIDVLAAVVPRVTDLALMGRIEYRLGDLYESFESDPVRAVEWYRRAREHAQSPDAARDAEQRIGRMERWIATGTPPGEEVLDDGHGHGEEPDGAHGAPNPALNNLRPEAEPDGSGSPPDVTRDPAPPSPGLGP